MRTCALLLIVVASCSAPFDGDVAGATATDAGADSETGQDARSDASQEPEAPAGDIGDPCAAASECTALLAGAMAASTMCLPILDAGFTCIVGCGDSDAWCVAHGGACILEPGIGNVCTK